MAHRKNTKRIDPRYFLHETVNRGEEVEEAIDWEKYDREKKAAALPTTFPPQALEDKGLQQWWPTAGKRPPKASPGEASDNNGIVFAVADGPAYFYGRGTAGSLWGLGYKDTGFWMPFE